MFLISKIKPLYFFISLFLGFLYTYTFTPIPDVVYQYPTPENVDKQMYVDKSKNCYKYKAEKINCPKDKNNIVNYPLKKE